MERRDVLIADPSEEYREALASQLSAHFQVRCCGRGDTALAMAAEKMPDLLILDLELPGLDGISLLRSLSRRPRVLVVSYLLNPFIQQLLQELDVEYAMQKPCPLHSVADRAFDLIRMSGQFSQTAYLRRGLAMMGLPSGRRGFGHLITGLSMLAENRDQQLSKELYDAIARQDNSTPEAVEKAIRETVRRGWQEGDRREWNRCFPGIVRCPSNREFLFRIADLLRDRQLCG